MDSLRFYSNIGPLICVLPFYYSRKHKFIKSNVYCVCFTVGFILFIVLSYYYMSLKRNKKAYNNLILILVDVINYILDVSLIFAPCSWNYHNVVKFFQTLTTLDKFLLNVFKFNNKTKSSYTLFYFIFTNCCISSVALYEYNVWHKNRDTGTQLFFLKDLLKSYYILYLVLILSAILKEIEKRIIAINKIIDNNKPDSQIFVKQINMNDVNKFRKLQQLGFVLCVDCNKAFGMHIFAIMIHIMFYIFMYLYMILTSKFINSLQDILITVFWIVFTVVSKVKIFKIVKYYINH